MKRIDNVILAYGFFFYRLLIMHKGALENLQTVSHKTNKVKSTKGKQ